MRRIGEALHREAAVDHETSHRLRRIAWIEAIGQQSRGLQADRLRKVIDQRAIYILATPATTDARL